MVTHPALLKQEAVVIKRGETCLITGIQFPWLVEQQGGENRIRSKMRKKTRSFPFTYFSLSHTFLDLCNIQCSCVFFILYFILNTSRLSIFVFLCIPSLKKILPLVLAISLTLQEKEKMNISLIKGSVKKMGYKNICSSEIYFCCSLKPQRNSLFLSSNQSPSC